MRGTRKSAFSAIRTDFPEGSINDRAKQKGRHRWFDPRQAMCLKSLQAEEYLSLDKPENAKLQLRLSFVKRGMSPENKPS
jgi:hypothetical protein